MRKTLYVDLKTLYTMWSSLSQFKDMKNSQQYFPQTDMSRVPVMDERNADLLFNVIYETNPEEIVFFNDEPNMINYMTSRQPDEILSYFSPVVNLRKIKIRITEANLFDIIMEIQNSECNSEDFFIMGINDARAYDCRRILDDPLFRDRKVLSSKYIGLTTDDCKVIYKEGKNLFKEGDK